MISCEAKILDLETAVKRTLNQSLMLSQAQDEIAAKRGVITQTGLRPNPEFSYDLSTSEKGWKNRNDIYAIYQIIELGGKRQKQKQAASFDYYAALTGYEKSRLERLNHLTKAFIRVAATQEMIKLILNQKQNSEEALNVIKTKVEAGKATAMQLNRALIAQSLVNLELKKEWTEFQAAKNSLALLWASTCPDFDTVMYPFFDILAPIPLEDYLSKLCSQPEIVQSLYRYMATYHRLRFEKSVPIPNIGVSLGYSYNAGDKGLVAGIAIPLPVWDQNQGNIKKTYHEMLKTETEGKQLWLFLETKLANAYLELTRVYEEVEELKQHILKTASQSLHLIEEGYQEGKFEYENILEAQKFLFEIEEKYIQALARYHQKRADIDYLTSQTD